MKTDTQDSWAAAELRRYSDSKSQAEHPAGFTPGPWVATLDKFGRAYVWQSGDEATGSGRLSVCAVHYNQDSNARLIAAAPELLEALEELNFRALIASGIEIGSKATLPGKLGAAMLAAGRAIAKATGRGEA